MTPPRKAHHYSHSHYPSFLKGLGGHPSTCHNTAPQIFRPIATFLSCCVADETQPYVPIVGTGTSSSARLRALPIGIWRNGSVGRAAGDEHAADPDRRPVAGRVDAQVESGRQQQRPQDNANHNFHTQPAQVESHNAWMTLWQTLEAISGIFFGMFPNCVGRFA